MGGLGRLRRTCGSGAAIALCALWACAPALGGTLLVDESFEGDTVEGPFTVGGTAVATGVAPCLTAGVSTAAPIKSCPDGQSDLPAGGDPVGRGTLRLTDDGFNRSGFVLFPEALPLDAGLDVTFEFFQYDGHLRPGFTGIPRGADGISFFLSDGAVPLTEPGSLGGGLGYAQKTESAEGPLDGLAGGYVGLGFDAFGNYANGYEGRGTGPDPLGRACPQLPGFHLPVDAFQPLFSNHVSLRGPGSGLRGYCLVRDDSGAIASFDVTTLGTTLNEPDAHTRAPALRRARIVIDPVSDPDAQIAAYLGGRLLFRAPLPDFSATEARPATLHFGFGAGTGVSSQVHELRLLRMETIEPIARLSLVKRHTGSFVVGGTGEFTLTASVAGGAIRRPITVTDTLPDETTLAAPGPSGSGWDCSASVIGSHTASCVHAPANGSLPPITTPVRFAAGFSGVVRNRATATSDDGAPGDAEDEARVCPTGADDEATTSIGEPVAIRVLDNDEGSLRPSTLEAGPTSAGGFVAWDPGSRVATYLPPPGFTGTDSFEYQVTDGEPGCPSGSASRSRSPA